jgi:type I restriction enzyme S subunit
MVNGELPDGWTTENISRVITKIPLTGRKLPQSEYLESGKYPVIDQGQSYIGGYSNDDDLVVPCKLPVIIFGDHTKAIKFVNFPFVAGADGVKVIKPLGAFSPKLFYYFLQAIELPNKGYARHFQYLEKETIPLPPLPEQERIVAKIEELFTQLEAGSAALKRVRAGLKRYKASVLKAGWSPDQVCLGVGTGTVDNSSLTVQA